MLRFIQNLFEKRRKKKRLRKIEESMHYDADDIESLIKKLTEL